MPQPATDAWDPSRGYDLSQLEEDLLLLLAQKVNDRNAVRELIRRHHDWARQLIDRLARRKHLSAEDRDDAEQNAVLAMEKAIRTYDVVQVGQRHCPFRKYLSMVLRRRYWNDLRRLGRQARRQRGSDEQALTRVADAPREDPGPAPWVAAEARDPAVAAEQHEWRQRLEQIRSGLKPKLRRLWDERAAGKTLEEIATELGVCANTVKGWLKKLTAIVRAAMRE